jgi:hypothetical protein
VPKKKEKENRGRYFREVNITFIEWSVAEEYRLRIQTDCV